MQTRGVLDELQLLHKVLDKAPRLRFQGFGVQALGRFGVQVLGGLGFRF